MSLNKAIKSGKEVRSKPLAESPVGGFFSL